MTELKTLNVFTKEQILKQIEKLQKDLIDLEEKEEVLYEDNKLKIIKWNKPINKIGFDKLATFQELINLIDSGKFKSDNGYFYTKHFSKNQWDREFCLSLVYLIRYSNLVSGSSDLADSRDNGRVVIRK
jgi:hypothetical protein